MLVTRLSLLVLAIGCGDGITSTDTGHLTGAPSCDAIIEACHEFDTGAGPLSECHDLAHDSGDEAICAPERTRCVDLCEAAAADGGGHDEDGGGHDEDGGGHDEEDAPAGVDGGT